LSKFERSCLCVHAHFSQPQRGNPLTGEIGVEADAAPYTNWNEQVTDSSIRPNAEAGNFGHISYSFNPALLNWLKQHAAETYQTIVASDQFTPEKGGHALATTYHHTILPLARRRDKRTQIKWGLAAFEHHFGRKPQGFWLPEMAVDTETLMLLAKAGICYTVLARKQIRDAFLPQGGGPYRVELPHEQSISVFVRDDGLSVELSFNIHHLGGAGRWSRQVLGPARRNVGPLLLLATAGETFGHHFAGEEQFLYWLVNYEARSAGYEAVTLDDYFLKNPPANPVQIEERSSWSDQPGLAHWATGKAEGKLDTTWKGGLRRALDNVTSELDRAYEDALRPHGLDPWALRDQYAPVLLGDLPAEAFFDQHTPDLNKTEREQLQVLLTAQELGQRMYSSNTFTDDRLDSRQPRYAIACAAAALAMAQQVSSRDLTERLLPDLAVVTSPASPVSGADILLSVVEELKLDLQLAQ
jgi:alpha-amylase/alpha-mannosidase (GH57 family)